MIVGVVNARLEATIRLPMRNATGVEQEFTVIIDKGFNGSLTLPPAVVASLGLPWRTRGNLTLANGKTDQIDTYATTVLWDGVPRKILVEAADTDPLVGMKLLKGFDLQIQVIDRGSVVIQALP